MKKIILLSLLVPFMAISQSRYHTDRSTTLAILNEPSLFEHGRLSIGVELFFSENHFYIHPGLQLVTKTEGSYTDAIVGIGYIQKYDRLNLYVGPRLGLIFRGGNAYPTAGVEGGIDFKISDEIFMGVRASFGYRSDFDFWGGKAEWRNSNFLKIGFRL